MRYRGKAEDVRKVRDVAAGSGFVTFESGRALGLKLDVATKTRGGATFFDVKLTDTTGKDRAVTLVYAIPVSPDGLTWRREPGVRLVDAGGEPVYGQYPSLVRAADGRLRIYYDGSGGIRSAVATEPAKQPIQAD